MKDYFLIRRDLELSGLATHLIRAIALSLLRREMGRQSRSGVGYRHYSLSSNVWSDCSEDLKFFGSLSGIPGTHQPHDNTFDQMEIPFQNTSKRRTTLYHSVRRRTV